MKHVIFIRGITCAIALSALSLLAPAAALTQAAPGATKPAADDKAPTPRTADGHPDLTGNWSFNFLNTGGFVKADISADGKERGILFSAKDGDVRNIGNGIPAERRAANKNKPPYKPDLWKKVEDLDDNSNKTDPTAFSCLPPGVPRIGAPTQILQSPGWVVLFYYGGQAPNRFRLIPTDGRPHNDVDPSIMGDSVGHWEGDTLVWETLGLKGDRDNDSILDRTGLILSDAARITARMRKINENTLQAVLTIEDSKALTKPWVVTKQFRKEKPGLFMYDYGCAENNRNPVNTATGETLVLGSDGKPAK